MPDGLGHQVQPETDNSGRLHPRIRTRALVGRLEGEHGAHPRQTGPGSGILASCWHWGNIGSFLAGLSTVVIAVAALVRSPGALRDFRTRQAAQADAARAQAELAREQAEETRLERRRTLQGWSPGGVETYTVALVTDPAEMDRAAAEPAGGGPTGYIVLRVDEGEYSSVNRGRDLRALIERQRYCATCRATPSARRWRRASRRSASRSPATGRALAHRGQPAVPDGCPALRRLSSARSSESRASFASYSLSSRSALRPLCTGRQTRPGCPTPPGAPRRRCPTAAS